LVVYYRENGKESKLSFFYGKKGVMYYVEAIYTTHMGDIDMDMDALNSCLPFENIFNFFNLY